MKRNEKRMTIISFAQKLPDMGAYEIDQLIGTLKTLAVAHKLQCENACNGVGYIRSTTGQRRATKYYLGRIDAYAKREHGNDVQDGNIVGGSDVFTVEIQRLENEIMNTLTKTPQRGFKAEFQYDPRGSTVKIVLGGNTYCPAFDF